MFGHFKAQVLSSNRKCFPLEVDFGASGPCSGPFWGVKATGGAPFKLRRKESLRLGSNQRSKRILLGHYLALLEYRLYIGVISGHFGGQNGEISAT